MILDACGGVFKRNPHGNKINEYVHVMKRRVHKSDIYRESDKLRTENESLMEDGLGALGVSQGLASDGSTHYSAEL